MNIEDEDKIKKMLEDVCCGFELQYNIFQSQINDLKKMILEALKSKNQ